MSDIELREIAFVDVESRTAHFLYGVFLLTFDIADPGEPPDPVEWTLVHALMSGHGYLSTWVDAARCTRAESWEKAKAILGQQHRDLLMIECRT